MNKYIKPEIKVVELKTEDIILTSALMPTNTVGGEPATEMESKPISIFDN